MIDLKKMVDRVARDSGGTREHFRKIGEALQAAALGDYRAGLTTGQVRLLGELVDQLAMEVVLGPRVESPDEQRSPDGYGVQDWGQL